MFKSSFKNSKTRDSTDFFKDIFKGGKWYNLLLAFKSGVCSLIILIPHKTTTHNNYSYPPTLADNLSPIGRETPRVDGSVSLVDRKFFCIYTH